MVELNVVLDAEKRKLEEEEAKLQTEVRYCVDRLEVVKKKLEHVNALLEVEESTDGISFPLQAFNHRGHDRAQSICDVAEQVLDERNGEPMHYKQLAHEVMSRGAKINGDNPGATLTARMVLDPRFVRPTAKGFYALRRDHPNARNVGARLRGSKRQRGI